MTRELHIVCNWGNLTVSQWYCRRGCDTAVFPDTLWDAEPRWLSKYKENKRRVVQRCISSPSGRFLRCPWKRSHLELDWTEMDTRYFHVDLFPRCCEHHSFIPTFFLSSELTCTQILTTVAGGSRGLSYIYGGRVISGVGIGGISAVAPAYVSECSPKNVRGRITGLFQIMVAIGVMLSYFINCKLSVSGSNEPRI
jgi:Sugar (and other) transporter